MSDISNTVRKVISESEDILKAGGNTIAEVGGTAKSEVNDAASKLLHMGEDIVKAGGNPISEISEAVRKNFRESDDIRDAGLTTPEDIVRFDDIFYGTDPAWHKLDVYRPRSAGKEKLPVLINVHGGGWIYGDKERYQYYCMNLAERGFAVVNFTYRLFPEFNFPAPLEDTNLVAGWTIAHAEKYGFDTNHIFAVGDSAGAHILALYAAICTNLKYASLYSSQIPKGFALKAIALNCGIYRLIKVEDLTPDMIALIKKILPEGTTKENLAGISPVGYISEQFPPVTYMTCTGDFLKGQASVLEQKLLEKNIPHEFHYFGNSEKELGHVFHLNIKSEDATLCNDLECAFFKRFL